MGEDRKGGSKYRAGDRTRQGREVPANVFATILAELLDVQLGLM
jgi:hypothetical protein